MPRTPCLPATSAKRPTAAGQTDAAPTAMPHPPIGRLPRRCRRSTVARYGGRISDTVRAARISTAGGRCTVRGGRERKTRHLSISFSFRAQPAANDPRSAASPNDRLYAERLSLDPRHERPISRSHPTERPNSEEDSNRGSSAVHALSNRLFRKAASPGIRPSDAFGHRAPPAGPVPQYACPAAETRKPGRPRRPRCRNQNGRPSETIDGQSSEACPGRRNPEPGRLRRPCCRNQNGRSSGSSAGTDGAAGCP